MEIKRDITAALLEWEQRPERKPLIIQGALGAGVDGCRGNRASARECAKAHSFLSAIS